VIVLWDAGNLSAPKAVHTLKQNGQVTSLAFSPDSHRLFSGSSDGFVHLWDLTSGDELARLPHTDAVTGLAFSNDSKLLLTVSRKVIQIWQLSDVKLIPTQDLINLACARLVTNLSQTVWTSVFLTEPYRLICPNLPQGKH
jgi:WD40 repeat protein